MKKAKKVKKKVFKKKTKATFYAIISENDMLVAMHGLPILTKNLQLMELVMPAVQDAANDLGRTGYLVELKEVKVIKVIKGKKK